MHMSWLREWLDINNFLFCGGDYTVANCLGQLHVLLREQKPYINGEAPCNCELSIMAGTIPA